VEQRRDHPAPSFQVEHDLYKGYFVAVRLVDDYSRPLWISRAKSDPNCNPERPNCILIQYFQPMQGHKSFKNRTQVGILKLVCIGRLRNLVGRSGSIWTLLWLHGNQE
jgi:hypothetical protein